MLKNNKEIKQSIYRLRRTLKIQTNEKLLRLVSVKVLSLSVDLKALAVAKDTSTHPVAYIHSLRIPGSRSSPACPAGSGSSALLRCRARSCPEPEQSERGLQNHQVRTFNSLARR